jgi:hypothetical protein
MKKCWWILSGIAAGISLFALAMYRRRRKTLMEERMHLGFANYEEWERFNKTFPCFVDKHPSLEALRNKMFVRKINPTHQADYIIFGLGRVCVEDFEQILNLCGNGFGIGALQLLRSMYERQVSAAFISKYPDEWEAFATYDAIHVRKLVQQFKKLYEDKPEILNSIVSEEEQAKIEEQYQAVKGRFMKTKCKKCETQELMFSWHKLDVGSMAGSGHQPALKDFFAYCYFLPLLMSHSTFKSVEARVVFKEDGSFSFESDGQRNEVKKALVFAHHLLLHVFDLQNDHFKLGLDDDIKKCEQDYLECWS